MASINGISIKNLKYKKHNDKYTGRIQLDNKPIGCFTLSNNFFDYKINYNNQKLVNNIDILFCDESALLKAIVQDQENYKEFIFRVNRYFMSNNILETGFLGEKIDDFIKKLIELKQLETKIHKEKLTNNESTNIWLNFKEGDTYHDYFGKQKN